MPFQYLFVYIFSQVVPLNQTYEPYSNYERPWVRNWGFNTGDLLNRMSLFQLIRRPFIRQNQKLRRLSYLRIWSENCCQFSKKLQVYNRHVWAATYFRDGALNYFNGIWKAETIFWLSRAFDWISCGMEYTSQFYFSHAELIASTKFKGAKMEVK